MGPSNALHSRRKATMDRSTSDASVDFVLEQIEAMVASEGGTLEAPSLDGHGSVRTRGTGSV